MSSYCPHCHSEIDYLKYVAEYTEYGKEFGTASLQLGSLESDERDSGSYETDNVEFYCPECDNEIYEEDELLDSLEGVEEEKAKEAEVITAESFNEMCFKQEKYI